MNYQVIDEGDVFIAYAKEEPFTYNPINFIYEPGEIYFEFGNTEEQALERLKEDLGLTNKKE